MNLRGRIIFFISAIIAGSAVGKEYNYEFGSDAGDEFYSKGESLVDPDTEIIIPVPNGIEEKMVKISVTSEDEPQVNTTFGDPSIRATIKFDRAPSPGSYYNITAKGIVKEGKNETLGTDAITDSATTTPKAETIQTASDVTVPDDNRRSAVPELDNATISVTVETDNAAPEADVDEASQSAASELDSAVSNAANQSDSAASEDSRRSAILESENALTDAANDTVEPAAATEFAGEASPAAADDVSRSAAPETENASTAAGNETAALESANGLTAASNKTVDPVDTPELASEAPLLASAGDISLSAASESENTSTAAANENAAPTAEAESNSTATDEDSRRSAVPEIDEPVPDQANQSGNASPAVENEAPAAAGELDSVIPVAVNQSDSAATELNGEEAVNQELAQSAAVNDTDKADESDSNSRAAVPDSESAPESVLESTTSVLGTENNRTMADAAEPQVEGESAPPGAEATTIASDNTSAAVSESSTTTTTPAPENAAPSNFALAAVAGLANAAQAAFDNVLGIPHTTAVDSGSAPADTNNAELAASDSTTTTTLGPGNGPPDEELTLNLSLN